MIRRPLLLVLALSLLWAGGCGRDAEPWDPAMQRHTLKFGGLVREYFVFLPSSYDDIGFLKALTVAVIPFVGSVSSGGWFYASTTSVMRHWTEGESCGVELQDWSSPTIEGANVQCTIACGDTVHPSIDCV